MVDMIFISDLAEFMNSGSSKVSDMMTPVVNNPRSNKLLWLLVTGVITIGCSYLGYRFAGGKVPSDD